MSTTGVQYTITVNKTGDGATQAINDFKSLANAAATTNTALAQNTSAMSTAVATTKTASSTFKAMQGTLTLIGMQAFPQLTLAATTAQAAISGLRTASAAAGVSMMAMAGPLAVIAAGAYKAYEALTVLYDLMEARKAESASGASLEQSNQATADAFLKNVADKTAAGRLRLTDAENEQLAEMLAANQFRQARTLIQGKLPMGDMMSDAEKQQEVSSRFKDFNRVNANANAYARLNVPEMDTDVSRQKQNVALDYNEQMALLNQMRKDGLLTERELDAFTMEADTRRVESMVELKKHVTELQDLERKAAEMFAGGLSTAIVKSFTEGGAAFKEFAQQFMAQMAQMIMQAAIMRALFGATGAASGTGGLIGGIINGAAEGGMFPRMMASGGMAGVSTVSQATYFPKFNVVAGEAGREMMTVLARPRMMEVGGMQAVVGSAHGQQLAITSAGDLAGRGVGGTIVIQVQGTKDFEARVVQSSVKGAVVQVAQDMHQDTPISRGVKGLTA